MRTVVVAAAIATLAFSQVSAPPAAGDPSRIYSTDPGDSWNRLFAALLTRTVRTRYTSEFPDRGPFQPAPERFQGFAPPPSIGVSTRVFDRYEDGDRAIDALYPTFLNSTGPREALIEPRRSELVRALTAALNDRTPRSPLARALMQADLWSAYDGLAVAVRFLRSNVGATSALNELSGLIARLIGQIALTRTEIAALPDNYEAARRPIGLPDLFHAGGEWLEVARAPFHVHEEEAQKRKAARVLMRPVIRPDNVVAFLTAATREVPQRRFSAVALVEQLMLIDRSGRVVASPLVQDVQMRTFGSPPGSHSSVVQYELSRRQLLANASTGGFVRFDDRAEAYITVAGNDYGFASPAEPLNSEPTITTLRFRCSACHGNDGTHIVSFSVHDSELRPPRVLAQPNDERARDVAAAKEARDDFKRLIEAAGLRR